MSGGGLDTTLKELNDALAMYLDNQRSLNEMLATNASSEELRNLKIEVDIAIEQTRVQIQSKLQACTSWVVGDVCQVKWEDGHWYTCTITLSPVPPAHLWGIRLLGYDLYGEVPADRLRIFEKPKIAKGVMCMALHTGCYLTARVDSVVEGDRVATTFAWVTFMDKAIHGQCVKVPLYHLAESGQAAPEAQRKRYENTAEDQKKRDEIEHKKKMAKRDNFRKKKEAAAAEEEARRAAWKEHQKKAFKPL